MTDTQKIELFDRVEQEIRRQLALMAYQQANHVGSYEVEFAKVNAYRRIAQIVTGVDPY